MTTLDFGRQVASWLETSDWPELPDGVLETALASTRGVRQRRSSRAILWGPAPWPVSHGRAVVRARLGLRLALVGILVIALIAASVLVGSRLLRPTTIRITGVLEPTGSMLAGRFEPLATLLADGMVLVTGGTGLDQIVEAELYDPAAGRFLATGSMGIGPAPGRVQVQIPLADGRVLAVGSTGGQADGVWPFTPFLRVYDPQTRSFSTPGTVPPDAFATDSVAWLADDGRVELRPVPAGYVPLVFDPVTGAVVNADDPGDDSGVERPSIIRLVDGRILRIFDGEVLHPRAELFDEAGRTVSELPDPPVVAGDQRYLSLLADGRVLVTGQATAIFDPTSMTFRTLDAPYLRALASLADGRALLEATSPSLFGDGPPRLWTFDPATEDLGPLGDVEVPAGCCATWSVLADGRVLGLGGMEGDTPSARAWILD